MTSSPADPRTIWNFRFSQPRPRTRPPGPPPTYEPWLERWLPLLARVAPSPVLDLGCGSGGDSHYLTTRGLRVIAVDFARHALRLTRSIAARAGLVEADVRDGLGFRTNAFSAIVANLSLHYHPWDHTCAIFRDVRRCLQPGGTLLVRVNATDDLDYGAQAHPAAEPHCAIVEGVFKRFFDQDDLEALFARDWEFLSMEAQVVHCYAKPKSIWEVVLQ